MTSVQFCYWLQGLFEVGNPKTLNAQQTQMIKNHLNMVFKHEIDNMYSNQEELQKLHDAKKEVSNDPFDVKKLQVLKDGMAASDIVFRC